MRPLLLALFTVGFTLPGLLTGCDPCDCEPGSLSYYRYLDFSGVIHFASTPGGPVQLAPFDTVDFDRYAGLAVEEVIRFGYRELEFPSRGSLPGWSTLPSALACDCIGPAFQPAEDQTFERFAFVSLYDFDDETPAGTALGELIVPGFEFLPVALTDSTAANAYRLVAPPTASDTFQVRLEVEMTDGRMFSAESAPVIFVR